MKLTVTFGETSTASQSDEEEEDEEVDTDLAAGVDVFLLAIRAPDRVVDTFRRIAARADAGCGEGVASTAAPSPGDCVSGISNSESDELDEELCCRLAPSFVAGISKSSSESVPFEAVAERDWLSASRTRAEAA